MSHHLLLPNKFKKIGWIISLISFILGLYVLETEVRPSWLNANVLSIFPTFLSKNKNFFQYTEVNLAETILGSLLIIGLLLVSFTKEKIEDEFIANIRLSSLLWAVLVNYLLLLLAFIFLYDMAFFRVMIYNMFTVLILFILRFHYTLYKSSKVVSDEK